MSSCLLHHPFSVAHPQGTSQMHVRLKAKPRVQLFS